MKLSLTKRHKWIVAGVVILGTATPGFALFGFGDIVFDPTSYGELVSQLSTMAKMLTTAKANTTPSRATFRTSLSRTSGKRS